MLEYVLAWKGLELILSKNPPYLLSIASGTYRCHGPSSMCLGSTWALLWVPWCLRLAPWRHTEFSPWLLGAMAPKLGAMVPHCTFFGLVIFILLTFPILFSTSNKILGIFYNLFQVQQQTNEMIWRLYIFLASCCFLFLFQLA